MRDEFYEIYRDLYDLYRQRPGDLDRFFFREFRGRPLEEMRRIRRATDALEAAISELGLTQRIRPDARHFLLVNLDQMVLLPLSHPDVRFESAEPGREELQADMRTILSQAMEESRGEEVTGHAVVSALSRVWTELNINRFGLWG